MVAAIVAPIMPAVAKVLRDEPAFYHEPCFDQISAATLTELRENIIYDEFFKDNTFFRNMRKHGMESFDGGSTVQEPFKYVGTRWDGDNG